MTERQEQILGIVILTSLLDMGHGVPKRLLIQACEQRNLTKENLEFVETCLIQKGLILETYPDIIQLTEEGIKAATIVNNEVKSQIAIRN